MSLPPEHLAYPRRRYGQDIDRYDWRPATRRAPIAWPGGRAVALMIVMPLEFFMLDPRGKPFKHPGAMQTPYPDLRHFTARDYGLRVGAFRILDALAAAGLTATVPINARLLARARPLVEAVAAAGCEIAACGWDTDSIHWSGLAETEEETLVAETRAAFAAFDLAPRAWMSPARQQSFATPDLIREAGFDVCLDWEMDQTPVTLRTAAGPLVCAPLMNELDDRLLLIERRQSEAEWRDQILAAAALMKEEHAIAGGQTLSFTLTPHVIGQPFRIWALRETLQALAADPAVWPATASAIADAAS